MALTKIFRIELTGGKDVEKDITSIKKAMSSMATAIAKAKGELAQLVSTKADPGAISSLTTKIADLEAKMKSLSQQRKNAETDAKRQAEAEKILADVKLKEAQASKAQEQADLARTQSIIAQEKELDRQIDRERKETEQLQRKKKELDAQPGSYNAIKKAAQELYSVLKNANSTSTVSTNGKTFNYDQAIAEYKRLSAAEQDFRRQFVKDGTLVGEYTTGIVQAFKSMNIDDIIKNQVGGAKQQLTDLEKKTQQLVVAYRQAQQQGGQDLDKLQKEIHDNVVETEQLRKSVQAAETQLKGIGGVGDQVTSAINKNFKELKNNIAQFALSYIGFQAIFSGLQTGTDNAKAFSDQTTELEIQLNKAVGGVDNMVDALAGINTRTKLTVLEDISNIASKAGTTEQNLLGVTRAIDTVKTAFGKDFGDIEQGTETFVKLINIFYDDGQVTEDRILKIGNSVRTLANETVASVPFINDFAGRMAGVRQVANVTLPQIIGLGAGFEEFKQSAEVSSTVLVKVIPQLARDIETFSNIAGTSREEFKKLLQENPIEALLKVSQGLVAGKGDIEVFANTLKEAGIDSGRATTIIATLGGKADIFRERIARAGVAIQDTNAITDAFNRKNENLAATLDKIGKKFADAAAGKGFQLTLVAISSIITVLIGHIPALLGLMGLLAIGWAVQNKELFILQARLLLVNAQLLAGRIALGVLTIAQTAYNAVLFIANGALTLATHALAVFGITAKATAGPLGVILTLATLLGAAYAAFGRRLEETRSSLSEYIRLQQINAEVSKKAAQATNDQISQIDGWVTVIRSAATSADTKRQALQKLIDINPAFSAVLQGQTIDLKKLDDVYKQVTESIKAKARAEAAASLSAEKQKNIVLAQTLRQRVEQEVAQQGGKTVGLLPEQITDAESEVLRNIKGVTFTRNLFDPTKGSLTFDKSNFKSIISQLKKKEDEAVAIYQDYLKVQLQAEADLKKLDDSITKPSASGDAQSETVFQIFDRLIKENGTGADFKDLLKKIQEKKKITDVLSKEYKDLLALEAKVKELLKPKAGSGGSHRSPEKEKLDNRLKEIDAAITEQKNALDEQLADGVISERDYYLQVRDITTNGEQQKIDTILEYQQKYKKALARFNGELEKDIADSTKKQIQAKREANQKLFDIDNKQLEIDLKNQQSAAGRERDSSLLNPELSNEEKLQKNIDYYNRLLKEQIVFNFKQSELERKRGIKSVENEQKRKEEIQKIKKELDQLELDRPEARQKDIQNRLDDELSALHTRTAERTTEILKSRESYLRKARQLDRLEYEATKEQLQKERDAAKESLDQAKKNLDAKLISRKDYLKKLEEFQTKEAALHKVTTDEQVTATNRFIKALKELKDGFLENVLGIKKYSKDAQGEAERIKDAVKSIESAIVTLVNDAYQSYFKNQDARIDRDKQEQEDTLNREKERVLARADSEAEKDTIERQYAQKQKEIEKKAAEAKRQNALKQASIDFAVAIIKTFAQFGFPLGLIPAAGLTALYLFQRSQIQKQQFAKGGYLERKQYGLGGNANEVPVSGGVFGGRPHSQGGTDFEFGGQKYNAEVEEMNIIRTRNAPKSGVYSITGSQKQIASALNKIGGGINFAAGAKVQKFSSGGYLGSALKAPYFSAGAYLNGGNVGGRYQKEDMQELKSMVAEVASAVYASDKKQVVLNPGNVTKAQKKTVKDVSTGTI